MKKLTKSLHISDDQEICLETNALYKISKGHGNKGKVFKGIEIIARYEVGIYSINNVMSAKQLTK